MIGTAAAVAERSFFIPALAVDDHRDDMALFTREMKKWNVKPRLFETAADWGRSALKSDADTILISDNLLPGVNDLESLGFPDIQTSQGEEAGLRLLTTYCDRLEIQAGLKILLTEFDLSPEARRWVSQRNSKGVRDKIFIYKKHKPDDVAQLDQLVRRFSRERRSNFIKDKLEYIRDLGRDWRLTPIEIAKLFSVQDEDDAVWVAATSGTTSLDFERRCDLIYRVKLNLTTVYGNNNLPQEAHWWRTKLPILGNKSPLEYVSPKGIEQLYSLVSVMEGNH